MKKKLDFNIVRLFNTYGPYSALSTTTQPQIVFIDQSLKKDPLTIYGKGTEMRTYQYVEDAVDGIMHLIESDYNHEIFNIGNPNEPIHSLGLAKKIWKMINGEKSEPKLNFVPQSNLPYEEIAIRIPSIRKARKMLGFEPKINLDEGLKRTIEWQKTII